MRKPVALGFAAAALAAPAPAAAQTIEPCDSVNECGKQVIQEADETAAYIVRCVFLCDPLLPTGTVIREADRIADDAAYRVKNACEIIFPTCP